MPRPLSHHQFSRKFSPIKNPFCIHIYLIINILEIHIHHKIGRNHTFIVDTNIKLPKLCYCVVDDTLPIFCFPHIQFFQKTPLSIPMCKSRFKPIQICIRCNDMIIALVKLLCKMFPDTCRATCDEYNFVIHDDCLKFSAK